MIITATASLALGLVALNGDAFVDAGRGPIAVDVPSDYDGSTPAPIVMLLHGYTGSGAAMEAWMQFGPIVDEFGFLLLAPDGTVDCANQPFWNATNACCNFCGSGVDDSAYLRDLIEELRARFNVDDTRIYIVGHSNGGFMAHRMACDHADTIAAIASLAGMTWLDPLDCGASEPVHVLQLHGTSDGVINYNGGCTGQGCYPGAHATCTQWATIGGCDLLSELDPFPIDLEPTIPGAETMVRRWQDGCSHGGSAELWSIGGGGHSPQFVPDFSRMIMEYFYDHPKGAPCPADLTGDGVVDVQDLVTVISGWATDSGDIDGDGTTNVIDLVAVATAWGNCP